MANTKIKTSIILAVTFIVGMVIGFFVNTVIVKNKIERFTRLRQPGAMEQMFIDKINPTEEQLPILEDAFAKFHSQMEELRSNSFEQLKKAQDSLFAKLKPILSDEQFESFSKEFFKPRFGKNNSGKGRRERHGHRNRMPNQPPPPPGE